MIKWHPLKWALDPSGFFYRFDMKNSNYIALENIKAKSFDWITLIKSQSIIFLIKLLFSFIFTKQWILEESQNKCIIFEQNRKLRIFLITSDLYTGITFIIIIFHQEGVGICPSLHDSLRCCKVTSFWWLNSNVPVQANYKNCFFFFIEFW